MILLEGVRAVALPCTLALLVPGVVVLLVGRLRPGPALAYAGAASLAVWATALGAVLPHGATGRLAGAAVLAAGIALARHDGTGTQVLGGGLVAVVSTVLWVPCVGPELGAALTAAPTAPVGTLLPLVAYGLGTMLPLVVAIAASTLLPAGRGTARWSGVVGLVLGGGLVAVLGTGRWADVVGALVRRSVL